jgi:hypothetical protein
MEESLPEIESQSFKKKHIQEIIEDLSEAIEKAADERDLAVVKDTDLRKALNVVENFLRESKRICYGGMALNAHLPPGLKFYDFTKTLPDYDFFSPNPDQDVKKLVHDFHNAGFSDVSARVGMHEGTTKIFVNFMAMADISYMPNWLYNTLKERAIKDEGIYYADADFLRMNLYLELSRPRGEVERWDKVYKRLLLLNSAKKLNLNSCKKGPEVTRLNKSVHSEIINYLSEEKLIYAGAELKRIYSNPSSSTAGFIVNSTAPVIVTTEAPEFHLPILRQIIHKQDPTLNLKNAHWKSRGDIIPEMFGLLSGGRVILLLIREQFCHSYNTVSLTKKRELRIASLDTAITMFYMLSFIKGLDGLVPKSCHCFAQTLVDISSNTRDKGVISKFPPFVLTCHGHQPTKASLLRAKAERIKAIKDKTKTKRNLSGKYVSSSKAYSKTRKRRI